MPNRSLVLQLTVLQLMTAVGILFSVSVQATVAEEPNRAIATERVTQFLPLGKGIRLVLEKAAFNPSAHRITYCEPNVVCLIDDYPVFGTEGALPRSRVVRLTLEMNGQHVLLEHRGMYNPWSPVEDTPLQVQIVEQSQDALRIRGRFSDGSATYVAEWFVVKGRAARTMIDCLECAAIACSALLRGTLE